MATLPALFAYFGPETLMPVTSVLATVAGIFLMFGRAGLRLIFRRSWFRTRAARHAVPPPPHGELRRRPAPGRDLTGTAESAGAPPHPDTEVAVAVTPFPPVAPEPGVPPTANAN